MLDPQRREMRNVRKTIEKMTGKKQSAKELAMQEFEKPDAQVAFELLRAIILLGWVLYPVGYLVGYVTAEKVDGHLVLRNREEKALNLIYNVADLLNKCAFGFCVFFAANSVSEREKANRNSDLEQNKKMSSLQQQQQQQQPANRFQLGHLGQWPTFGMMAPPVGAPGGGPGASSGAGGHQHTSFFGGSPTLLKDSTKSRDASPSKQNKFTIEGYVSPTSNASPAHQANIVSTVLHAAAESVSPTAGTSPKKENENLKDEEEQDEETRKKKEAKTSSSSTSGHHQGGQQFQNGMFGGGPMMIPGSPFPQYGGPGGTMIPTMPMFPHGHHPMMDPSMYSFFPPGAPLHQHPGGGMYGGGGPGGAAAMGNGMSSATSAGGAAFAGQMSAGGPNQMANVVPGGRPTFEQTPASSQQIIQNPNFGRGRPGNDTPSDFDDIELPMPPPKNKQNQAQRASISIDPATGGISFGGGGGSGGGGGGGKRKSSIMDEPGDRRNFHRRSQVGRHGNRTEAKQTELRNQGVTKSQQGADDCHRIMFCFY
ncbi:unnamed protein product [Amoebophrya sp. A120]|nr:unnamed protein product [Amoebophrya sp. A120]|eukprot:GSA120T00001018001.1